jgi:hypothetical protein
MTMRLSGGWLAALVAAVGVVQALDSGVLHAGTAVQVLVAAALLGPVAALATDASYGVQAASVVAMGALLTWARWISPVSLNALHIMLVPAALLIFTRSRRDALKTL